MNQSEKSADKKYAFPWTALFTVHTELSGSTYLLVSFIYTCIPGYKSLSGVFLGQTIEKLKVCGNFFSKKNISERAF